MWKKKKNNEWPTKKINPREAGIIGDPAWIGKQCFDPYLRDVRYFISAYPFLSCLLVT